MKFEANQIEINAHPQKTEFSQGIVLREQVRIALQQYFSQLNGHAACGLHTMVISEVEKPLIQAVLEYSGGNQSKAAKVLGISRSTLRKKMIQYRID